MPEDSNIHGHRLVNLEFHNLNIIFEVASLQQTKNENKDFWALLT